MKPALVFLFFLCFAMSTALCQATIDLVQLKNGKVYRGQIIKKEPDGTIELEVGRKNIMVFSPDEIERIGTETPAVPTDSLKNYGGDIGLGFALGGGGVVGVPLRANLGENAAIEFAPYLRPTIANYGIGAEVDLGLLVAVAIHFNMLKKYEPQKEKVVSNGLFIRYGRSFGKYSESLLGFGWAGERFKKTKRKMSFVHELGPGIVIRHWFDKSDSDYYTFPKRKVGFALAWKVHINSYLD